ncbi:MAG TPA: HPr family phosphocarrier protein, partial [Candidatus Bathyarchaeia archaeon]|nr:HPr family phosphocarrier protein [Candidatus Bathyarchaeia archaeon]
RMNYLYPPENNPDYKAWDVAVAMGVMLSQYNFIIMKERGRELLSDDEEQFRKDFESCPALMRSVEAFPFFGIQAKDPRCIRLYNAVNVDRFLRGYFTQEEKVVLPKAEEEEIAGPDMQTQRTVTIVNPDGIHVRPSMAIRDVGMKILERVEGAQITLSHSGETADVRQIMAIARLAAVAGSRVTISVEGVNDPGCRNQVMDLMEELLLDTFYQEHSRDAEKQRYYDQRVAAIGNGDHAMLGSESDQPVFQSRLFQAKRENLIRKVREELERRDIYIDETDSRMAILEKLYPDPEILNDQGDFENDFHYDVIAALFSPVQEETHIQGVTQSIGHEVWSYYIADIMVKHGISDADHIDHIEYESFQVENLGHQKGGLRLVDLITIFAVGQSFISIAVACDRTIFDRRDEENRVIKDDVIYHSRAEYETLARWRKATTILPEVFGYIERAYFDKDQREVFTRVVLREFVPGYELNEYIREMLCSDDVDQDTQKFMVRIFFEVGCMMARIYNVTRRIPFDAHGANVIVCEKSGEDVEVRPIDINKLAEGTEEIAAVFANCLRWYFTRVPNRYQFAEQFIQGFYQNIVNSQDRRSIFVALHEELRLRIEKMTSNKNNQKDDFEHYAGIVSALLEGQKNLGQEQNNEQGNDHAMLSYSLHGEWKMENGERTEFYPYSVFPALPAGRRTPFSYRWWTLALAHAEEWLKVKIQVTDDGAGKVAKR